MPEIPNIMKVMGPNLKELFPEYADEIDYFSRTLACGCSICVWKALQKKYPDLELPVEYQDPYLAWG